VIDQPVCDIACEKELLSTDSFKAEFLNIETAVTYSEEDFEDTDRAATTNYPDSDADIVASKCAVIKEFKATGLHGSEPCWYYALGIVRHCVNGIDKCHEFSAKDKDYKERETTKKINQQISNDVGPPLCETFKQFGMCSKCKHKVVTPLQLGIFTEMPVVEDEADFDSKRTQQLIDLAPAGKTWIINSSGIYRNFEDEQVLVCDMPFYITDLICEDFSDETVLTAVITTFPADRKKTSFKLPYKYLSELTKLLGEFYARAIFPVRKHIKDFLIAYFNNLKHIIPYKTINSLGWQQDNSFIYNSKGEGYSTKTKKILYVLDRKMAGFTQGFETKGNLKAWQQGIIAYQKDAIFMPYLFSMFCSLGAPLLAYTTAKGCVVSLQGPSGCGKTLSHKFALSVWGDPERAGVIGTKDTHVARVGRMSAVRNLPLRLDEITTVAPAQLSGMIYELVNGRGRSRANIDGSLSSTAAEWQTITLITTNYPLLDNEACVLSEAERCRILELEAPMPSNIIEVGKCLDEIMHQNYGLVGPIFMKHVVRNKLKVIETISKYYDYFQYYLKEDKRFWATCGAAAFTAASIANHLNLIEIDVEDCLKWFLNTLQQQTVLQQKSLVEARGFSGREEFVTALKDSINNAILYIGEDGQPKFELNQPVKGRIASSNGKSFLYVRTDIFKDFVRANYKDSIEKVRSELGIAKSKSKRFGHSVIRCYELELSNVDC
jgi:hypothetical protein